MAVARRARAERRALAARIAQMTTAGGPPRRSPSPIHCLRAFHILFFAYLLFRCYYYNHYKTKNIIFIISIRSHSRTGSELLHWVDWWAGREAIQRLIRLQRIYNF